MLIAPIRKLFTPSRFSAPVCPRCRKRIRRSPSVRSRTLPYWPSKIDAVNAAGDVILDASGNVMLDDAGNVLIECCCFRQARNCADNTTQNVWMKSSDATSYTGAFKIGTSTCYYFNFSDSPSSSPGTLYGPSDVTATGASCAALCPTMTPACAGVATLAVVTANGISACACASDGDPSTATHSEKLIGDPNGVFDLSKIGTNSYSGSTSIITNVYTDAICGTFLETHMMLWTINKVSSNWVLTLSTLTPPFQSLHIASGCDTSLDFTNNVTDSTCHQGQINTGYGGSAHVDFFA